MKYDFSKLSDAELNNKISNRTLWIEAAYVEAADRADKAAGDDRCGELAEMALKLKGIHYAIKQFHCEASIVVCRLLNVPMPRSGER